MRFRPQDQPPTKPFDAASGREYAPSFPLNAPRRTIHITGTRDEREYGVVKMSLRLTLFSLAAILCGTGLRADPLLDTQGASAPALFSLAMLPLTLMGMLLALATFLYASARRG